MPNPKDQHLHERFPLLWAASTTDPEQRTDLELTDSQFGAKWRRHKSRRLAELQRHEDQLALVEARRHLERVAPVIEQLEHLGGLAPDLHAAVDAAPRDLRSAEATFRLTTLRLHPSPHVADHQLERVLDDLRQLRADDLGCAIVRESICAIERPTTYAALGERFGGKTKQTVADRKKRLEERLCALGERHALSALRRELEGRLNDTVHGRTLPASDPFTQIATLTNDGDYPTVVDVVRAALWLASGDGEGRRAGMERLQDGSLRTR